MNKLLLSTLLICGSAATAQNMVVPAKERETNAKEEVVASYYLPKTVFEIEVEASNKKFKAGPYANDAKRFFGTYAESQDRNSWEVTNIRIKKRTEPDPAQHYKVYATYGSTGSLIALTEDEILRGVNLSLGFDKNPCPKEMNAPFPPKGMCDKHHKKHMQEPESKEFKTNFKYKENDSIPDKENAQFAFDLINSLRMTRADLLQQNGDDVHDVNAFIHQIEKEEKELTELFFGKYYTENVKMTFTFTPDKEGNNQEICKFSARNGFEEVSESINISIKKKNNASKVSNPSGKSGYVYRIPAIAEIDIKQGKKSIWKGTMEIPQLGTTESLPAGFFDKNDLKALFDKETGALLQISK